MSSKELKIISCQQCGVQNRIPSDKLDSPLAKCGRCGAALMDRSKQSNDSTQYTLRCGNCKALNRIPVGKLAQLPKCGKCGNLIDTSDISSPGSVTVTDANFTEKVTNAPLPVLMYAWAPWCSGCQSVGPLIDQFAADARGKVRVGKLNVDGNPTLASKFNILSVPFLYIFDKGELKESMPAALDKHSIMLKMAKFFY